MAGELQTALERLSDRKRSILGGESMGLVDDDALVAVVSGFDLDRSEFLEFVERAVENGVRQTLATGVLNLVLGALWVDGLATGLLVAQAREFERREPNREELTMIALALKNQGIGDDEPITPERGVEILIERLAGARR